MSCGVGRRRGSDPRVAVAVAYASSCSSDLTPSLGTSNVAGVALKRKKKKRVFTSLTSMNERLVELVSLWIKMVF